MQCSTRSYLLLFLQRRVHPQKFLHRCSKSHDVLPPVTEGLIQQPHLVFVRKGTAFPDQLVAFPLNVLLRGRRQGAAPALQLLEDQSDQSDLYTRSSASLSQADRVQLLKCKQ